MITPVARIVTRMQGGDDGLMIGTLFKTGVGFMKPNTIYEIRSICDVLTIVEIGRATGAGEANCTHNMMSGTDAQFHWGQDIGNIIACHGQTMFLTEKEYAQIVAQRKAEYAARYNED